MGTYESKAQNNYEEFKKEYFKLVNKEMSDGIKLVKSTIYCNNERSSGDNENWLEYLKENLNDYIDKTTNKDLIQEILKCLDNPQNYNETIYQYNLKLSLANSIDDISLTTQTNKTQCIMYNHD